MMDAETTTSAEKAKDSASAATLEKHANTTETEKPQEHEPVYGPIEDELFGKRIRKSFGSRAFWGTIVTTYVVGQGVFYKVSFDDGDVDIFSTGEVLNDLAAAKRYANEDPAAKQPEFEGVRTAETPTSLPASSQYADALRAKSSSLKRRRDSFDSENTEDCPPVGAWHIKLWSVRLFATIMEEQGYICLHEFVPMANSEPGEMESTGKVKPGDALVAVQGRLVHGRMDHTRACDLIRAAPRPVTLTFIRPPKRADSASVAAVNAAIEAFRESSTVSIGVADGGDAVWKKARVDVQGESSTSAESPSQAQPSSASTTAQRSSTPLTTAPLSRDPPARSHPPTPETRLVRENQSTPPANFPPVQGRFSAVHQPPRGLSRTPSPPVDMPTFIASPTGSTKALHPQVPISGQRLPHHRPPRTPSPAPPVDGFPTHSNLQQSSSAYPYQPPRQNMAQPSGSNQLQTVYIPAHLASLVSAPASSSARQVVRHVGPGQMPAPMSHTGPLAHHPQHVPTNERQNGQAPGTSSAMHSNSRMVIAGSGGFHRYDHSARASFAPSNNHVMHQRAGSIPVSHASYTNAAQDPRYAYSRQMYGPALSNAHTLGLAPNAPHQSHSSASSFERLPVRQGEQLPSDDRTRNMTLGDYMVFTAQQERLALRLASEQRNLGGTRPASQPQPPSSALNPREPLTNPAPTTSAGANHEHQESPPPPATDEGSSFLNLKSGAGQADTKIIASTGTSFLSLDQISILEEIPVNVKAKASRMRDAFRQATAPSHDSPPRPPYLSRYDADGVVTVVITQPRLYLTLAPMGQYVSISSFVRGDLGEVGEIEASGIVLAGDVLVGVGAVEIPPFMSPGEVARIVNSQPRPYSAYFIRATWEMLE